MNKSRKKAITTTAAAPEGRTLVDLAARTLFSMRCEDIQLIDLRGKSDVADWFLICTAASEPQMQGSLAALERDLKGAGIRPLGIEYRAGVRWAVLDVGEIMVHIFEAKAREEYSLERLWRDGKLEVLDPKAYQTKATAAGDGDGLL